MLNGFLDIVTRDRIAGWAVETDRPEAALTIAVFANEKEVARGAADSPRPDLKPIYGTANHGFDFRIEVPFSPAQTIRISVRETSTNKILRDSFLFGSSEPSNSPGIRPIVLSSTRRCGTTIMMSKLLTVSGIIVAGDYPYEMKLLTYYAHAARILCTPAYDNLGFNGSNIHLDMHRIGLNPFFNYQFCNAFKDSDKLYTIFGQYATEKVLEAFQNIIRTVYDAAAVENNVKTPRFFAEKFDILTNNREYLKLLFGEGKEILLVRDLRDVYCSSKSFWSVSSDFMTNIVAAKTAFMKIYAERSDNLLLVKYEELIRRPDEVMSAICTFLNLEISSNDIRNDELVLFKKHGTSSTPEDSAGRWKRDLSESDAKRFSDEFSDFFEMFGYEQ
jgi:hypothetical protein